MRNSSPSAGGITYEMPTDDELERVVQAPVARSNRSIAYLYCFGVYHGAMPSHFDCSFLRVDHGLQSVPRQHVELAGLCVDHGEARIGHDPRPRIGAFDFWRAPPVDPEVADAGGG